MHWVSGAIWSTGEKGEAESNPVSLRAFGCLPLLWGWCRVGLGRLQYGRDRLCPWALGHLCWEKPVCRCQRATLLAQQAVGQAVTLKLDLLMSPDALDGVRWEGAVTD